MRVLSFCVAGFGALLVAHQVRATDCHLQDFGTLPVEMIDGQPTTMVKINGVDTRFMLDTGASLNTMSRANAVSLGLKPKELQDDVRIAGVGGDARAEIARVKKFGILGMTLSNVDFIVGGSDTGYGLIGANLLNVADLEIDLGHGKVTLFRPNSCDKAPLAYWSKDGHYNVVDMERSPDKSKDYLTVLAITIDGKKLRALVDSGASVTVLSRDAAEQIGIDLNGPGAKPSMASTGIGSKAIKSWTVNIGTFSVGGETIRHTSMDVLDGSLGDREIDMLLGADFLLAHRMYIANSQHKVYFTYNAGRVFGAATAPSDSKNSGSGTAAPLQNAADYALRGEAHLSRGDPNAAIADLDEAIHLAPDQPAYYLARARAHVAENQLDAASVDLDKIVSLDPKNVDALLLRASVRLSHQDSAGAMADVNAASTLTPSGSTYSRDIASLYIALDQPASALPLLDAWIRMHDNDVLLGSALNARCWARSLNNQLLDDALSDCRKAIKRDGENPAYLESLGLVQLRLGKYSESIHVYERALAQNSGSAWTHYGLGLAKIRIGQNGAGNADLVAARAIDPGIDAQAAKFGLTVSGQ